MISLLLLSTTITTVLSLLCILTESKKIEGPITKVDLIYSDEGVPYITAKNNRDLFYAQGYATAELRMFQMEYHRRLLSGRLSTFFGTKSIEQDTLFKKYNFYDLVKDDEQNLDSEILQIIDDYVAGVNTYLKDTEYLPPEFQLYDIPLEDFTIADVLVIEKYLSYSLSSPSSVQLLTLDWKTRGLTEERIRYYLSKTDFGPQIVPEETTAKSEKKSKVSTDSFSKLPDDIPNIEEIRRMIEILPVFPRIDASNNWVVSKSLSNTKGALLCNDPHLRYSAPNLWFLVSLRSPEFNSIGASIAGVPGIGIGRNDKISWGYTNVGSANQQLYVIENNSTQLKYRYNGQWKDYEVREETIEVKGGDSLDIKVYETDLGVVVVGDPTKNETILALQWSAFDANDTGIYGTLGVSKASNFEEFRDAVRHFHSVSFNAVFADVDGNIGYQLTGAIPKRETEDVDGSFALPGDGSKVVDEYIPFEELYSVLNPKEGYIVTANNIVDRNSSYYYGPDISFAPGFRAQRIVDMINDSPKKGHTISTMKDIQKDVNNLSFKYLSGAIDLLDGFPNNTQEAKWLDRIKDWNGFEYTDSQEATVFKVWVDCLANVTLPEIGRSWRQIPFLGKIFHVNNTVDDTVCTMNQVTCKEYATNCFVKAVDNGNIYRYGDIHKAVFAPLGYPPDVEYDEWKREIEVGGSAHTVNAASGGNNVVGGPGYRQVIDMKHVEHSYFMIALGQSGDPRNEYYDDLLHDWKQTHFLEMASKLNRKDEDMTPIILGSIAALVFIVGITVFIVINRCNKEEYEAVA